MENWKNELDDFLSERGRPNRKTSEERLKNLSEDIVLKTLKEIKNYIEEYRLEVRIDVLYPGLYSHNIAVYDTNDVIFFYQIEIEQYSLDVHCFWSSRASLKENYSNFLLKDEDKSNVNLKDLSKQFDTITKEEMIEHFVESFRINCFLQKAN